MKPACIAAFGRRACSLVGFAVPRGLGFFAALALFGMARPEAVRRLLDGSASLPAGLGLNLAGFGILVLPGLVLSPEALNGAFARLMPVWLAEVPSPASESLP